MSIAFRILLQKVGGGEHTSEDLTRSESAAATRMMLLGEATPAQIGAFLIAHRIKRPTPAELAGMLDAYEELGPQIPKLDIADPLVILGHPYDGRTRTAPVGVLVALILATAGSVVLLHGSESCPTKYGLPLVDLWSLIGVEWRGLSLDQVTAVLANTGVGFLHLPQHFPLAQTIMTYRDEIGKRPPFATLELIWAPYNGSVHVISGFVHPPTEANMVETFKLRDIEQFTTVKGLEGSCDLARDRTAILSLAGERLLLKPRDFGMAGSEVPLPKPLEFAALLQQVLNGSEGELTQATLWNIGFYLWRLGHAADVKSGIELAKELLLSGKVAAKRDQIRKQIESFTL